uniref:SJCHGC02195 protein n=1 Tax=Schistosoma japonicum TaxID=6182 RepID=Q5DDV8_SCHJA|nr:SJCHGC02195 protein [Schistosoma japonicum]
MTSIKRIGTHDGCFHCDEVLAVVLLKHLPEYKNASVVRSRDPDVLSVCDVVVDVGGVYDPQTYRFDHHQKDFSLTWSKYFDVKMWDVKLSSAGLVYVHFGKRVLSLLTGLEINHEVLEKIFMRVYESFILEIDGQDNGTPQSKMPLKVRRLNPWWNSGSEESEGESCSYELFLTRGFMVS